MQTLIAFIVVLGVLITTHELGHYWVARRCGVKVIRFSVGFGRPIYKRVAADGTEWVVALFPLGGYVKMLDEREGEVSPSELHRSFNRQSLIKRSMIVVAGPLANFVTAIVLFWLVFMGGTQELRALTSSPKPDSAAAYAGFEHGDRITSVNGQSVTTWQEMSWEILQSAPTGGDLQFESINVRNEIAVRRLQYPGIDGAGSVDPAVELGLTYYRPKVPPVVAKVMPDSAAESAGFRVKDRILSVDGKPIGEWQQMVELVRASGEKKMDIEVERDGRQILLQATPRGHDDQGRRVVRIGLQVDYDSVPQVNALIEVRHGPVNAMFKALDETWEKSVFTLRSFGKMITGELSWKNLSGPVTIADYAGQSAKRGWTYYLQFMALVSISLGVLNLLPVPLLDGGHLMYYAAEAITRRPLSERLQEIGQQIGLALLIGLMAFAFYNDIQRLISS